jgi:hypothetical protein
MNLRRIANTQAPGARYAYTSVYRCLRNRRDLALNRSSFGCVAIVIDASRLPRPSRFLRPARNGIRDALQTLSVEPTTSQEASSAD